MNSKSEKNESQPETKNVLFKPTLNAPLNSERPIAERDQQDVTNDYVPSTASTDSPREEKQPEIVTGEYFTKLATDKKIELTGTLLKRANDQKQLSVIAFIGSCIGLYFLKGNFERGELEKFCSEEENKITRRCFYRYAQVGDVFKGMADYAHVGTFTASEIIRICDLPEITRNVILAHKIRMPNRKLETLKSNHKTIIRDEVNAEKILHFLTRFRDKKDKNKKPVCSGSEIDFIGDTNWLESVKKPPNNTSSNKTSNAHKDQQPASSAANPMGKLSEQSPTNIVEENLLKLADVANHISAIYDALQIGTHGSETLSKVAAICGPLNTNLVRVINLALSLTGGKIVK